MKDFIAITNLIEILLILAWVWSTIMRFRAGEMFIIFSASVAFVQFQVQAVVALLQTDMPAYAISSGVIVSFALVALGIAACAKVSLNHPKRREN